MSRRSGGEPALLLRVALAALLGGALAAALLAAVRDVDRPVLIAGLVVAVAAVSVLAAAALTPPPPPPLPPSPPAAGWPRAADQTTARPLPARFEPGQPAPHWPGVGTPPASKAGGKPTPAARVAPAPAARWNHAPTHPTSEPASAHPTSDPTVSANPAALPMSVAIPVQGGAWWQAAAAGTRAPAAAADEPARDGTAGPAVELADHAAATRIVQCPRCGDFGVDVHQQEPGFAFTCNRCGHDWRWEPGSSWPVAVVRPRSPDRPTAGPSPGRKPEPS